MKYSIEWHDTAYEDSEAVRRHLDQFSETAFSRIMKKIISNMELIKVHPYMYEAYERRSKYRRMVVEDYLLFYKVFEAERRIEVVRILHSAMDIEGQL